VSQLIGLVLSGGGGERLSVLTTERAVSAVPFGGKYRIIDFVLSNCCHSGIEQLGILTQHAPTSLHDHIGSGRAWDLDRRAGGVLVLQPYQTRSHAGWYRGTADAIAQNWDLIDERKPDRVLVLSGDHVYRMDYRALLHAHESRRAALTMAVTRVPPDQSRRFGMVRLDRDGRMLSLVEKPEKSDAPFASMGIYLFDRAALVLRLGARPVDLVLEVVRPMLEEGERVYGHVFEGYWEDVGTIGSFYQANLELLRPRPRFGLYDSRWPILTRDEARPPVLTLEGAEIESSLVANGSRVAGRVRNSVLFPGVRVGRGAEITDSVIMADAVVEPGARIDRAIVDKYVRVGEGALVGCGDLRPGADPDWLDGLVLVGKDSVLPAGLKVERSSVIGVGSRPEDFGPDPVASGSVMANHSWFEDLR
jgi:glucose-1-phosphate adenylyltransferase